MSKKVLFGVLSGVIILIVAFTVVANGKLNPFKSSDVSSHESNQGIAKQNSVEPQENNIFPSVLLGQKLVGYVEGTDAISQISQLHGTNVGTKEGFIASYQNDTQDKMITVWISVDPADKAKELFVIMDKKISTNPNIPFKGRKELKIGEQKVIYVTGMGQDHYYWVDGERNYWVAFGGLEDSEKALEAVIDALK